MKISKKQLQDLSNLARIELTDTQKKLFTLHISDILDYVEKIKKVKSKKELYAPSLNFWAQQDEVREYDSSKLLKNTPEVKENQVKVKAVFDNQDFDL
ncbi:aspartyl/glutamyl-tRNA amidotransferase subunit C [Patescibacteria group bacterium]